MEQETCRVGIAFERISPGDQTKLDRYVFQLDRRDKVIRRHLTGAFPSVGHRRRQAHRVSVVEDDQLVITFEGGTPLTRTQQVKLLAHFPLASAPKSPTEFEICDVSVLGCAYLCPVSLAPAVHSLLNLRLISPQIDIALSGHVVYLR